MNEVVLGAVAAVIAAGVSGVSAVLAARTSRTNEELRIDIRELRTTILRHLENHP